MYLDKSLIMSRCVGSLCAITASINWQDLFTTIGLSLLGTGVSYFFSWLLTKIRGLR